MAGAVDADPLGCPPGGKSEVVPSKVEALPVEDPLGHELRL